MWSYLWQNFLKDFKYKKIILDKIDKSKIDLSWENLIEVWPGKWAISKYLVDKFENITFFEKDESFKDIIEGIVNTNHNIVWWDVLEADLIKFEQEKTFVFWNIPYYITSPIFRKFFVENNFIWWFMLIQKEVWLKIKTDAEKKSFLWWLLNHWYKVDYVKTVPAKAFNPVPKVDSCLIYLSKLSNPVKINLNKSIEFLDLVSWYKRKTMWKIENILRKKWIDKYNIDENIKTKRLEDLNWDDMKKIIL